MLSSCWLIFIALKWREGTAQRRKMCESFFWCLSVPNVSLCSGKVWLENSHLESKQIVSEKKKGTLIFWAGETMYTKQWNKTVLVKNKVVCYSYWLEFQKVSTDQIHGSGVYLGKWSYIDLIKITVPYDNKERKKWLAGYLVFYDIKTMDRYTQNFEKFYY